jgi:SAM-dependent methyltransferase
MRERERQDQVLFDQIARHYAKKDIVLSSSLARRDQLMSAIRPLLDALPNLGAVVEIGCGVGAPAKYLEPYYDHYIGIDQSDEMIRAAICFNQGNSRVRFIADNVKSPELPRNAADVVLSIGALHHMTHLEDVLRSLTRIAKPRAYLLLVEPQDGNPVIQAMRYARGIVDRSYSSQQIYFGEQDLTKLLADGGISVLSVAYQGFLTPPFAQVIVRPQALSLPLARLAILADSWLEAHLPPSLRKLSFDIAVIGRFGK